MSASIPTPLPSRLRRLRLGASMAVTALCGLLSLATSSLPTCTNYDGRGATKALSFAQGEAQLRVRVTADDTPLILDVGALGVLGDMPLVETHEPDPESDAGVVAGRYWLVCDTTSHEPLLTRYETEDDVVRNSGNRLDPYHYRYHVPVLDLGPDCEFTLVRTGTDLAVDTSIQVNPVLDSCRDDVPYYGIVIEVVE